MSLREMTNESNATTGAVNCHEPHLAYEEAPVTRFHAFVAAVSAGGLFSDGYALGTIGVALSIARHSLHLGALWLGMLGSASLAGLFLGSLFLGPLADRIGRRPLFVPTMAVFAIVSLLQLFVRTGGQLLVLRLLLGLMLGIDYVACSTVLLEFAPRHARGRLLSLLVIMWTVGYTLAFAVGAALQSALPDSWRWILASGALPSAIVFLLRLRLPESPLWLVQRGRSAAARRIIDRHLGANIRLPVVAPSISQTAKHAWTELFSRQIRSRTAVGATFFTAQVIPYFAINTFIPIVFAALDISDPYTSGVVSNIFLLLGSVFGLWLVDKVTRRQFLIGTFYISAAILLILVLAGKAPSFVIITLFAMFAFVLSAATDLELVYLPELFPTRLRASGVGVGTAASRVGSALGTFLLPVSLNSIGIRPTLGLCVAVLLTGGIISHLFAPETCDRSIEDV